MPRETDNSTLLPSILHELMEADYTVRAGIVSDFLARYPGLSGQINAIWQQIRAEADSPGG
ncbi:MAG: hypothetical protein SynsKO_08380 [Synoicihabitans sp.]